MKTIKKYWKTYLEELWYMVLVYWFAVAFDWAMGNGLDLFHPYAILLCILISVFYTWLDIRRKSRN